MRFVIRPISFYYFFFQFLWNLKWVLGKWLHIKAPIITKWVSENSFRNKIHRNPDFKILSFFLFFTHLTSEYFFICEYNNQNFLSWTNSIFRHLIGSIILSDLFVFIWFFQLYHFSPLFCVTSLCTVWHFPLIRSPLLQLIAPFSSLLHCSISSLQSVQASLFVLHFSTYQTH